jgi:predicted transcriptional regulator
MSRAPQPTSIRLSEDMLRLLDKRSKQSRRSRSFIVEEALQAHLSKAPKAGNADTAKARRDMLASLRKRAEAASEGLSAAEIDARARDFRGED